MISKMTSNQTARSVWNLRRIWRGAFIFWSMLLVLLVLGLVVAPSGSLVSRVLYAIALGVAFIVSVVSMHALWWLALTRLIVGDHSEFQAAGKVFLLTMYRGDGRTRDRAVDQGIGRVVDSNLAYSGLIYDVKFECCPEYGSDHNQFSCEIPPEIAPEKTSSWSIRGTRPWYLKLWIRLKCPPI